MGYLLVHVFLSLIWVNFFRIHVEAVVLSKTFWNSTNFNASTQNSCSSQSPCTGIPSKSVQISQTTPAPKTTPSVVHWEDLTAFIFQSPCQIDQEEILTLTWPDRYITVATVTTLVSIFQNTTLVASSTYTDVTASMELYSILDALPARNSRTSVLNGTAFTDPYGVVYQSPTAITIYDKLKYLPAPTITSGWLKSEWAQLGEVFSVLPSGYYFSGGGRDVRSWLVDNPPAPLPTFWSTLSDCDQFLENSGPQAYKHIVESITAYETTTTMFSSALPTQAQVTPAATPTLPTPSPTPLINTPNQPASPGGVNIAAEESSGPEGSAAAEIETQEPKFEPILPIPKSTLDDLAISLDPVAGSLFVGGQPLSSGDFIIESGTILSLDTTGTTLFVDGSPHLNPSIQTLPPLGPERSYFTIGTSTYSQNSASEYEVDGQTLRPGDSVIISGTTVSLDSFGSSIFINNTPVPVQRTPPTTARPQLVFGGTTYCQNGASNFEIASQILTPGGVVTVSGTTLSLAPKATEVFINNIPFPVYQTPNIAKPQLVIGDSTYFQDTSSNFVIASQTLIPGGIITASGTTISLDPQASEAIINNIPFPIRKPSTGPRPQLILGASTYLQNPNSAFEIASQTLKPGGIITVAGTTLSLDPKASEVVINNTPSTLQAPRITAQPSPPLSKGISATAAKATSKVSTGASVSYGLRTGIILSMGLIFWNVL
ncbi:hypothetical protein HYFRA_00006680 [Hymenoscyphus fraxineus]|uniref:Uncharacterized protein n=1 Tax=Hymenoscyphus fraxineus TaxID=746836 RepID=A0A9N9KW96_9HELO|nr:hypothetical protein HYFRA_00006680 [Hymenoscyphus fraxineus]